MNNVDFTSSTRNFYFTAKEQEVLHYMARCYTYNEIIGEMKISKRTLYKHIENIGIKTGIRTQARVSRYAIEHGYGMRQEVS